jgi:hypothetical protein
MNMRRIVIFVTLLVFSIGVVAQDIKMTIVDGIQNKTVKARIEQGISALLSEINRACAQERELQLDNIDMVLSGKKSLQALWQNYHFLCEDNQIVERCLTSAEGYVVRNIYTQVNPLVEDYSDEPERALTIRLTRDGQIASVAMAASDAVYGRIIEQGLSVTDLERRTTILSFVENYRSFYDEKDLKSIERVFSDDAIIITGTVPMQRNVSSDMGSWREQIKYKVQNKPQYLKSLTANFHNNKFIKVTFSDVEVVRHPANPNYYGVTLHQHWKSSTYEDDGYLLLIWEFQDGKDPIIHYRTWQPDRIGSHSLTKDEIINIMDFNIPTLD